MSRWGHALIVFAALASQADAFVSPSGKAASSTTTLVAPPAQVLLAPPPPTTTTTSLHADKPAVYGEDSRPYRRTVYTHNEWETHRSPNRFWKNLQTLTKSGIYKSLAKEVLVTTLVATFVCAYNAAVGGYTGLDGSSHPAVVDGLTVMGLPLTPFTLLTPSLGLLLVFRTNSSYKRWDEARKAWGLNINHTRDLARMATAWYGNYKNQEGTEFAGAMAAPTEPIDPVKRQEDLERVSLCTWAFVRSMKRHLSPPAEDEEDFKAELYERLPAAQAEKIIAATHRPNKALHDLSCAIDRLPMHFLRKNQINTAVSIFEDTLGGCERLLSSPVPVFYSRHTARFLSVWLILLPLALWEPFAGSWNHVGEIPATALISICLFGIEELATSLEEPFTILPMQGFCDKIGANCDETVSWAGQGETKEVYTEVEPMVEQKKYSVGGGVAPKHPFME
jgi:putative membrane protein